MVIENKKFNKFFQIAFPVMLLITMTALAIQNNSLQEHIARRTTLYNMMTEMFDDYCKKFGGVALIEGVNWGEEYKEYKDAVVMGCARNINMGWLVYTNGELVYVGGVETAQDDSI